MLARVRSELLTFVVAALLIALSWQTLRQHEDENVKHLLDLGAVSIQADLVADMAQRLRAQTRLAQLWDIAEDPQKRNWEASAKLYIDHYPGTLFIEWVPSSNGQGWVFPQDAKSSSDALREEAALQINAAIATARAERKLTLTHSVQSRTGQRVIVAVTPVFRDGALEGVVIAAHDIREALRTMMEDVSHLGYGFAVLEGSNELYALSGPSQTRGGIHSELPAPELGWTVRVWPEPELMKGMKSVLPEIVAAAMGVLAIMVLLAIRLAQLALRQTRLARETNETLFGEVTERRRAEESARLSEAKYAGILDSSADAIISVSSDQRIVLFNEGAEKIFGYRAEEVLGKPLDELLPPNLRDAHRADVTHFAEGTVSTMRMCDRRPVSGLRKDGSLFPAEATVSKLETNEGIMFTAILRDITERKRTEEALHQAHDELESRVQERTAELAGANTSLRQLSGSLLASQEDERRRIARELHDSTAQLLVLAIMNLENLRQSGIAEELPANELLSESIRLVEEAAGELRTVSYRLHPPMLEEFGLAFSLRWYVNGFSKRIGIAIEVNVDPELGRFESDIEMTVFRIVQESLTNVHRHSHAASASVNLTREGEKLRLVIADNGTGMAPGIISGENVALMGVGLHGMRERVHQIGGTWNIHSGTDGTTITAVFSIGEDKSIATSPHGFSD